MKRIKEKTKENKKGLYNFDIKTKETKKDKRTGKKGLRSDDLINPENEIIIGVTKFPEVQKAKQEQRNKKVRKEKNAKVLIEKKNDKQKIKHNKIKKNNEDTEENKIQKIRIDDIEFEHIEANKNSPKNKAWENKKKHKKIAKIIKWTSLFVIITGTITFAMLSPMFNINKITVNGNNKVTTEKITGLSEIKNGTNIFRINKVEIINNIKKDGYIDEVTVKRKLPSTIAITVQERKATFLIEVGNAYAYINNQGYILEVSNTKLDLTTISGIKTKVEDLKDGKRLITEDLEKLEVVLKIMSEAEVNGIKDIITSVDISDETNYTLYFAGESKKAYLGDCSNIASRISNLKVILKNETGKSGEIFVNMNLNSQNPFFRESV